MSSTSGERPGTGQELPSSSNTQGGGLVPPAFFTKRTQELTEQSPDTNPQDIEHQEKTLGEEFTERALFLQELKEDISFLSKKGILSVEDIQKISDLQGVLETDFSSGEESTELLDTIETNLDELQTLIVKNQEALNQELKSFAQAFLGLQEECARYEKSSILDIVTDHDLKRILIATRESAEATTNSFKENDTTIEALWKELETLEEILRRCHQAVSSFVATQINTIREELPVTILPVVETLCTISTVSPSEQQQALMAKNHLLAILKSDDSVIDEEAYEEAKALVQQLSSFVDKYSNQIPTGEYSTPLLENDTPEPPTTTEQKEEPSLPHDTDTSNTQETLASGEPFTLIWRDKPYTNISKEQYQKIEATLDGYENLRQELKDSQILYNFPELPALRQELIKNLDNNNTEEAELSAIKLAEELEQAFKRKELGKQVALNPQTPINEEFDLATIHIDSSEQAKGGAGIYILSRNSGVWVRPMPKHTLLIKRSVSALEELRKKDPLNDELLSLKNNLISSVEGYDFESTKRVLKKIESLLESPQIETPQATKTSKEIEITPSDTSLEKEELGAIPLPTTIRGTAFSGTEHNQIFVEGQWRDAPLHVSGIINHFNNAFKVYQEYLTTCAKRKATPDSSLSDLFEALGSYYEYTPLSSNPTSPERDALTHALLQKIQKASQQLLPKPQEIFIPNIRIRDDGTIFFKKRPLTSEELILWNNLQQSKALDEYRAFIASPMATRYNRGLIAFKNEIAELLNEGDFELALNLVERNDEKNPGFRQMLTLAKQEDARTREQNLKLIEELAANKATDQTKSFRTILVVRDSSTRINGEGVDVVDEGIFSKITKNGAWADMQKGTPQYEAFVLAKKALEEWVLRKDARRKVLDLKNQMIDLVNSYQFEEAKQVAQKLTEALASNEPELKETENSQPLETKDIPTKSATQEQELPLQQEQQDPLQIPVSVQKPIEREAEHIAQEEAPQKRERIVQMDWPSNIKYFDQKERSGWFELNEKGAWVRITDKTHQWDAVYTLFKGSAHNRSLGIKPLYDRYIMFFTSGTPAEKKQKKELYQEVVSLENEIVEHISKKEPWSALTYCETLEEKLAEAEEGWKKEMEKRSVFQEGEKRREQEQKDREAKFQEIGKEFSIIKTRAERALTLIGSELERNYIERSLSSVVALFNEEGVISGEKIERARLAVSAFEQELGKIEQKLKTIATFKNTDLSSPLKDRPEPKSAKDLLEARKAELSTRLENEYRRIASKDPLKFVQVYSQKKTIGDYLNGDIERKVVQKILREYEVTLPQEERRGFSQARLTHQEESTPQEYTQKTKEVFSPALQKKTGGKFDMVNSANVDMSPHATKNEVQTSQPETLEQKKPLQERLQKVEKLLEIIGEKTVNNWRAALTFGVVLGTAAVMMSSKEENRESTLAQRTETSVASAPAQKLTTWRDYVQTPEKKTLLSSLNKLSSKDLIYTFAPSLTKGDTPLTTNPLRMAGYDIIHNHDENLYGLSSTQRKELASLISNLESLYSYTNAPEVARATELKTSYTPKDYGYLPPKTTLEDYIIALKKRIGDADKRDRTV